MTRRPLRLLAALAALALPAAARAQEAELPRVASEIVRGKVTDDSARALGAATVIVTRGPDRLVQQTTTDSAGLWSLKFEPGTGDYLVAISAPGFRAARRRVQRQA